MRDNLFIQLLDQTTFRASSRTRPPIMPTNMPLMTLKDFYNEKEVFIIDKIFPLNKISTNIGIITQNHTDSLIAVKIIFDKIVNSILIWENNTKNSNHAIIRKEIEKIRENVKESINSTLRVVFETIRDSTDQPKKKIEDVYINVRKENTAHIKKVKEKVLKFLAEELDYNTLDFEHNPNSRLGLFSTDEPNLNEVDTALLRRIKETENDELYYLRTWVEILETKKHQDSLKKFYHNRDLKDIYYENIFSEFQFRVLAYREEYDNYGTVLDDAVEDARSKLNSIFQPIIEALVYLGNIHNDPNINSKKTSKAIENIHKEINDIVYYVKKERSFVEEFQLQKPKNKGRSDKVNYKFAKQRLDDLEQPYKETIDVIRKEVLKCLAKIEFYQKGQDIFKNYESVKLSIFSDSPKIDTSIPIEDRLTLLNENYMINNLPYMGLWMNYVSKPVRKKLEFGAQPI